jgi:hypothetical protein
VPVPIIVHRPCPNRLNGAPQPQCEQTGAELLLSAGLLAALLLPDSAPASKRPLDWRNNLAAHPHPAPTQRGDWLRRWSMPTPRFRKSIQSNRARMSMSMSVLVRQARQARTQWTRRRERRGEDDGEAEAPSALVIYARRGTQSLHIPRYCTVLFLPPTSSTTHQFFLRISQSAIFPGSHFDPSVRTVLSVV